MPAVILLVIALVAFIGWHYFSDEALDALNKQMNIGTLEGVDKCTEEKETPIVKLEVIRSFCANQFQTEAFLFYVNGRAGPRFSELGKKFSGEVFNDEVDWIVTQLDFRIDLDVAGKKESLNVSERVWLEPDTQTLVSIELDSLTDDRWEEWRKCMEGKEAECFTWELVKIFGVEIK